MKIKFNTYMIQQLGTLYKSNELDLKGQVVNVIDLDMNQVDRIEVNYSVSSNKYTAMALISDKESNEVIIPFGPDVLHPGSNKLELVAYMIDGSIKPSQTCIYDVKEGIGSNDFIDWPDGSDNPGYATIAYVNNAIKEIELTPGPQGEQGPMGPQGPKGEDYDPTVLNDYATITYVNDQRRAIEGYAEDCARNAIKNLDLSDYATKDYVDASVKHGTPSDGTGGSVDLSDYATKEYVDESVKNVKPNLDGYATETYVDDKVSAHAKEVKNAGYAFQYYVDENFVTNDYLVQYVGDSLGKYPTKKYVDEAIANIDVPKVDLTGYATEDYVNDAIGDIGLLLDIINGEEL